MKKIALLFIFFVLGTTLLGCGSNVKETYRDLQIVAKEKCDNRNGALIHFGLIVNPISNELHYESVCYKEDERHFYYDLIK